ncbi:MAG: polysaccharide biosynthesis tyrosine autokinase [Verrucomicrobiota bacterium]
MEAVTNSSPTEAKLHFLDYWRIVCIRKWLIFGVFLLVAATATLVTFWLPKTYSSLVRIEVEKDDPDIGPLGGGARQSGFDPYYIQTQFEILQSRSVLTNVIDELKLNEKWAKRYGAIGSLKTEQTFLYLSKRIQLRQVRNTTIVEIRVFSEDHEEAAIIANKIAEVYRDNRLKEQLGRLTASIGTLEKERDVMQIEVDAKKAKVDELRTKFEISDFSPESTAAGGTLEPETLRRLEQDRINAEQRWTESNARYENMRKMTPERLQQALVTVQPDPLLEQLLRDRDQVAQELVIKQKDYGPQHPEVDKFKESLAHVKTQIQDRVEGIMEGLKAIAETDKAKLDKITAAVQEAADRSREMAKTAGPYFDAKRDYESAFNILDVFKRKIVQERSDAKLPRTITRIIDPAVANDQPVSPRIFVNVALGIILGLIVGVGLAFFVEYLDTSVKTIDDVERALQAPVVGVIPQDVGSLIEEGEDSPHAEAYRVLRTNILFARKDEKFNALTIVSGGAGEGKSTTIFNLAVIFAQNGHRVLLVDSDLRRPSLHKLLKISNSIGLTNYLLKQNALTEVIQVTPQANLHFLPSGKLPASSIGILNSTQMREFIQEAKRRYDFVFFDSPPVLGVSDASILVSEVDMALLVVQYRKYPQAMTLRAKQTVDKYGNLLGVVLNNINIAEDSNYYYYSGYYYDHYSREDEDEEPIVKEGASKADADKDKLALKQKY